MDGMNCFTTNRNILCLFDVDGTLTPARQVSLSDNLQPSQIHCLLICARHYVCYIASRRGIASKALVNVALSLA